MTTVADLRDISDDVRADVERGVQILKAGGCREVYVFGDVVDGRVAPYSEIDFGVRGCPPTVFFRLQGELLMELTRTATLWDLDADPGRASFLERHAGLVRVG